MTAKLTWDGLDEMAAQLFRLPIDLREGGERLTQSHAATFAARLAATYPLGSAGRVYRSRRAKRGKLIVPGGLKRGVRLITRPSRHPFGALAIVESAAPHAWIFENGTVVRQTRAMANRGAMPRGHVFIPMAQRQRRLLEADLMRLAERQGLTVTVH